MRHKNDTTETSASAAKPAYLGNDNDQAVTSTNRLPDDAEIQRYLEQRKAYIDREDQLADLFDKSLITISTGALGGSFVFAQQVKGAGSKEALSYLSVAWIFLALALICSLSSMFLAQRAHSLRVRHLDASIEKRFEADQWRKQPKENGHSSNHWATWTSRTNILSLVSIVLGIVFLMVSSCQTHS